MKILVCMKQVIDGGNSIMDEDFVLNREKNQLTINPADCIALEQALRLQDSCMGEAEITVLTMGPEKAENLLHWVASYPVSQLVLVSDPLYRGSDTLATARVLSAAAAYLGGFDLVLMGRRAIDGETGHVGPEVSAFLEVPCITNVTSIINQTSITNATSITNVTSIDTLTKEHVTCCRLLEQKRLNLQVSLPAVITLCGGGEAYSLRPASIMGMKRAKTMSVLKLSNKELKIPLFQTGLKGSPTWVVGLKQVPPQKRKTRFYENPQEGAKVILELLQKERISDEWDDSSAFLSNDEKALYYDNKMNNNPEKPKGTHGVFVYGEEAESIKTGLQLIHHAFSSGCKTVAVVIGRRDAKLSKKLISAGAMKVFFIELDYTEDDFYVGSCLAEVLNQISLESLVFPATVRGRTIAPICAAKKELGITADCTEIRYQSDGTLLQIRPTFGETKLAEIQNKTKPQLATVRPNIYPDPSIIISFDVDSIRTISFSHEIKERVRMVEQETLTQRGFLEVEGILAGGKDLRKEDFQLLQQLGDKLNFQVGASRSAVDKGSAPYEVQIGQTGKTVRPKFYMAFGISGAVQHLAGMKDSDVIIAVNKDKKAPIFDCADVGICADWKETAKALMDLLQ